MRETAVNTELNGLSVYLVHDGLLDAASAKSAAAASLQQNIALTSYLVRSGILSSNAILSCCAKHFGLPVFDLNNCDDSCLREPVIKPELMLRYRVIPLFRDKYNNLHVGVSDPTNHGMLAALGFHTGLHIHPMLVEETELDRMIDILCRANTLGSQLETALANIHTAEEPRTEIEYEQNDEPVIAFVDRLLHDAMENQVSDIHIEPYEQFFRIRFRHDGLLSEAAIVPRHLAARLLTRVKIMANLNIAERRLPQDGRFQLRNEHKTDVRVNVCPTLSGEKIVLRLLNRAASHTEIHALGMTAEQLALFKTALRKPQGLILVTGPTGSGKTITLYSALHYLNQVEKNISTVEDPVEIELSGINQTSIHPAIGLDFAALLRSLLRQDPDIIMVGEIRDQETATIAIQAAHTGHLVLTTLHTNSAVATLLRLRAMGIAAYHLASSLSLIIAQRLVRLLCRRCQQSGNCRHCKSGYQGRTGIFELLPINEKITQLILSGAPASELLAAAKQEGFMLLAEAGRQKVLEEITSEEEIQRVLG